MKIDFTGRGIDITDRIRDFTESKLARLKKHLEEFQDVSVVLSVEKYRRRAEIGFRSGKRNFHGTEETDDLFAAIDKVVDKLETQVKKHKDKDQTRRRNTTESIRGAELPDEADTGAANDVPQVIPHDDRLRVMNIEEAVLELDRAEQPVYVYRDGASEQVHVLYRRADGNIGLVGART